MTYMDIKKIKTYVVKVVIGFVIGGVFSLIPFYFITINTLAQHSEKINGNTKGRINNAKEVDNLNHTIRDNELAPIVIQGKIELIKKDIKYILKKQDEHEETLDEIHGLLMDLIRQNNN